MSLQLFTPHEVALQLGVNSHTVRRWCADFAAHLTDGANPRKGEQRRLMSQDIEVLREVQRLRGEGLSTPAINKRLSGVVFQAPIVESSQTAPISPQQTQDALMVVEVLRSVEARLQALEQARSENDAQRPTWRDVFIIGLSALFVGVMIGLSIWWFQ